MNCNAGEYTLSIHQQKQLYEYFFTLKNNGLEIKQMFSPNSKSRIDYSVTIYYSNRVVTKGSINNNHVTSAMI